MGLGCIVMACGSGTRYTAAGGAGNKLLADAGGVPLIVRTVGSVPAERYDVVVALRVPEVASALARAGLLPSLCMVEDEKPRRSAVVRRAMEAAAPDWEGVLFLPGDQPLVSPESFRALADALAADPARAWRLSWQGRAGSPVLFPRSCFAALRALRGSEGGGALLARGEVEVGFVPARGASELWDVDTPDDLARIASISPRP